MKRWVIALMLSSMVGGFAPVAAQDEEPGIAQERIAFGELPSVAVALDGFMWVLDRRGATIGKIDPTTNEVVDVIDLLQLVEGSRSAWDLEAARGSLWLTLPAKNRIARVDPESGDVTSVIRARGFVSDLYVARGALWFTSGSQRGIVLVRMDPLSEKTVATFRLGKTNTGVAAIVSYGRHVWVVRNQARHVAGRGRNVTFYVSASLWRIDPRSNRMTKKAPLGATYTRGPVDPVIGDVEAAAEGLWLSRNHERRLTLVNPGTARVLDVESTDFRLPWEIEVLGAEVWAGDLNRPSVVRIDPDVNRHTHADVGNETSQLASGFGSIWLPLPGEVVRLTPQ
ncbi:MAG: hypothetical protein M3134_06145 [Actinomycetota bacterium]|nr:hypothetical protein [Actinomycetota bacterium]